MSQFQEARRICYIGKALTGESLAYLRFFRRHGVKVEKNSHFKLNVHNHHVMLPFNLVAPYSVQISLDGVPSEVLS